MYARREAARCFWNLLERRGRKKHGFVKKIGLECFPREGRTRFAAEIIMQLIGQARQLPPTNQPIFS